MLKADIKHSPFPAISFIKCKSSAEIPKYIPNLSLNHINGTKSVPGMCAPRTHHSLHISVVFFCCFLCWLYFARICFMLGYVSNTTFTIPQCVHSLYRNARPTKTRFIPTIQVKNKKHLSSVFGAVLLLSPRPQTAFRIIYQYTTNTHIARIGLLLCAYMFGKYTKTGAYIRWQLLDIIYVHVSFYNYLYNSHCANSTRS